MRIHCIRFVWCLIVKPFPQKEARYTTTLRFCCLCRPSFDHRLPPTTFLNCSCHRFRGQPASPFFLSNVWLHTADCWTYTSDIYVSLALCSWRWCFVAARVKKPINSQMSLLLATLSMLRRKPNTRKSDLRSVTTCTHVYVLTVFRTAFELKYSQRHFFRHRPTISRYQQTLESKWLQSSTPFNCNDWTTLFGTSAFYMSAVGISLKLSMIHNNLSRGYQSNVLCTVQRDTATRCNPKLRHAKLKSEMSDIVQWLNGLNGSITWPETVYGSVHCCIVLPTDFAFQERLQIMPTKVHQWNQRYYSVTRSDSKIENQRTLGVGRFIAGKL